MSATMAAMKVPARLPNGSHQVIVRLETAHVPASEIDTSPYSHELISYEYTSPHDAALIAGRIQHASIVATTTVPINVQTLGEAPFLKCVITETTGTNHIDLEECKRRGIVVYSAPGAPTDAVSEHAIGLYFAARRSIVNLHNAMQPSHSQANMWRVSGSMSSIIKDSRGQPPHTCGNELVGIIGFGAIGQRIAKLCQGLGMTVLVAERKHSKDGTNQNDPSRTPFADVVRQATVLFVGLPLLPQTRHTVGRTELNMMRPDAIIINVGRGNTVDEVALFEAVRNRKIYGAATNLFESEPAGSAQDSVLLSEEAKGLNITLTPHLAWCADQTTANLQEALKENIRKFLRIK